MSEQELVRRIQEGDTQAFRELYDLYARLVYRYTMIRTSNSQDAEDITSEVFTKAWQAFPSFRWEGTPVKAWLLRIAHNLIVDRYRKKKDIQSLFPWTASYRESRFKQIEQQDELQQALMDLSYDEQILLHLEFFEGYSLKEIADFVGKSPNAVRVAKHRALKRLRTRMTAIDEALEFGRPTTQHESVSIAAT